MPLVKTEIKAEEVETDHRTETIVDLTSDDEELPSDPMDLVAVHAGIIHGSFIDLTSDDDKIPQQPSGDYEFP